jgi:hypothetical protein
MQKVTVHKVQCFDVIAGEMRIQLRMATREGARRMQGEIIEGTAVEVDVSQLEPGEQWTPRGFVP